MHEEYKSKKRKQTFKKILPQWMYLLRTRFSSNYSTGGKPYSQHCIKMNNKSWPIIRHRAIKRQHRTWVAINDFFSLFAHKWWTFSAQMTLKNKTKWRLLILSQVFSQIRWSLKEKNDRNVFEEAIFCILVDGGTILSINRKSYFNINVNMSESELSAQWLAERLPNRSVNDCANGRTISFTCTYQKHTV